MLCFRLSVSFSCFSLSLSVFHVLSQQLSVYLSVSRCLFYMFSLSNSLSLSSCFVFMLSLSMSVSLSLSRSLSLSLSVDKEKVNQERKVSSGLAPSRGSSTPDAAPPALNRKSVSTGSSPHQGLEVSEGSGVHISVTSSPDFSHSEIGKADWTDTW